MGWYRSHRKLISALAVAALLGVPLGSAGTREIETAEDIENCLRDNLPEDSSLQTVTFKARDRTGAVKESRATIYWRKFPDGFSKVMVRVSDPPKLRGAGLLLVESEEGTDRFLYLPALRKVRRITKNSSSGALLGTDFTYDQLERIQGLHDDRRSTRLEDSVLDERSVYVLESRPGPDDSSTFERVVSYVDPSACVLLKAEFFERGDQLRKVLYVDPARVEPEGTLHIPRYMRMEDLLEGSSTELVLESIEVGKSIPDRTFSRKELMVGRR